MAVDVSRIPNNNKFDPVREAILQLQTEIEDTGATIGNGTLTISTSSPLTGSGTFTANQTGPTSISIGIDGAEYLTNITHDTVNQKLVVTYGDGTTADLSLAQYIDDTNLARLVSGSLDNQTGIATFTRDDATTFTVDLSALFDDTDTNDFLTGASFASNTLTFTVSNQNDVTVDLPEYITLGDLSVSTNATPFGSGALLYDEATGDFEYTPPDLSSYATTSQLNGYLPLSGGSVTGLLTTNDLTVLGTLTATLPAGPTTDGLQEVTDNNATTTNPITLSGSGSDMLFLDVASTTNSTDQNAIRYLTNGSLKAQVGVPIDNNRILADSNADDYVIKSWGDIRFGGGTIGTTTVIIDSETGDIGTVGDINADGDLNVDGTVTGSTARFTATSGHAFGDVVGTNRAVSFLNSGLAASNAMYLTIGKAESDNNQAEISFYYDGVGSASNLIRLGLYGNPDMVTINGNGHLSVTSGNIAVDTGVIKMGADTVIDASRNIFANDVTASSFIKSSGVQSEFLKADGTITTLTVVTQANNTPISSGGLFYDTLTGNFDFTPPNLDGVISETAIDAKFNGYLSTSGGTITGLLTTSNVNFLGDATFSTAANFNSVAVFNGQVNYNSEDRSAYWSYDNKVAAVFKPAADDGAVAILFPSIGNSVSDFGYIAFDEDYGEAGVAAGENSVLLIGCENDGLSSSDHVRVKGRLVVEADMSSSDPTNAFQVKSGNVTGDLFRVARSGAAVFNSTLNVADQLSVDDAIRLTSNPSITGDSSGVYFWNQAGVGATIASNAFEVRTNGNTTAFSIDNALNATFNGDITTSGSGSNVIRWTNTGAAQSWITYVGSNDDFIFRDETDSRTVAVFQGDGEVCFPAGNVGIGTTTPSAFSGRILQIHDTSIPRLKLTNSSTGTENTDGFELLVSGNDTLFVNRESGAMTFSTSATERMRITAGGEVGINVTSPAHKLHIDSNSNSAYPTGWRAGELRVANDNSSNVPYQTANIVLSATGWAGGTTGVAQLSVIQDGSNVSNGTFTIKVRNNGTHFEAFRIKYDGNVGIGNTSPSEKLDVAGNIRTDSSFILDGASTKWQIFQDSSDFVLRRYFGGWSERLRIQDDTGNVGIGTTSPSHKLTVDTDTNNDGITLNGSTANLRFNIKNDLVTSGQRAFSMMMSGSYPALIFQALDDSYGFVRNVMAIEHSGEVGIGTITPAYTLDVNGSSHCVNGYVDNAIFHTGDTNTYLQFHAQDQFRVVTGGVERLEVANAQTYIQNVLVCNDYVGIGTTSPQAKLDVNGTVLLGREHGVTQLHNNKDYNNMASGLVWREYNATGTYVHATSSTTLSDYIKSYNFTEQGIATTVDSFTRSDDTYAVEFVGYYYANVDGVHEFSASSDDSSDFFIDGTRVGYWYGGHGDNNAPTGGTGQVAGSIYLVKGFHRLYARFQEGTGGDSISLWQKEPSGSWEKIPSTRFYHKAEDLFRATGSGNATLYGTFTATADIVAYSDERIKENVETIDNALDKVQQLRGVSFNRIKDGSKSIGVIAQEIEKVLPEVVTEDDKGIKGVAYGNVVGVLIEAIKEQQKQIDELKARLDGSTY